VLLILFLLLLNLLPLLLVLLLLLLRLLLLLLVRFLCRTLPFVLLSSGSSSCSRCMCLLCHLDSRRSCLHLLLLLVVGVRRLALRCIPSCRLAVIQGRVRMYESAPLAPHKLRNLMRATAAAAAVPAAPSCPDIPTIVLLPACRCC
jgi:hypothetical protein